jgi:hypothetical protein
MTTPETPHRPPQVARPGLKKSLAEFRCVVWLGGVGVSIARLQRAWLAPQKIPLPRGETGGFLM